MSDLSLSAQHEHGSEEMVKALWEEFDNTAATAAEIQEKYAPGNNDLEDDYNQNLFLFGGYERDYSGI